MDARLHRGDRSHGGISRSFQTVDGSNGIPRVYIVDDRLVVWSGHPDGLDPIYR